MKEKALNTSAAILPSPSLYPEVVTADKIRIPAATILKVSQDDLEAGYEGQAAWFATISFQAAKLGIAVEKQERHIKELEAKHYLDIQSGMSKKPSEATLKAMIAVSTVVREAYAKLFKMQEDLAGWDALRAGLAQRKDMLINYGASSRIEKKSAMSSHQ